jgi:dTDP-glucose 4,6-dehydratase
LRIFVTGGLGFIGSNYILNKITDSSIEILNYDKVTYAANFDNLSSIQNNPNYHFIKGDICNSNKLYDSIKSFKPEIIINFAAESHVDRSIDSPLDFIRTNVLGTTVLLESCFKYYQSLANKNNFRFLHISTDEVFGELGDSNHFKEETPYAPNSPYSASKACSDHLVRAWNKTFDLPILISNCSNNFGPFQFPEKLIPLMIIKCLNQENLPVYGNGENIRDWIHVLDHCSAIDSILNKGDIGETYLIGSDNEMKNIDIVKLICKYFNDNKYINNFDYQSLIMFVDDRPGHDFRYAIDSSKIKNKLGWKPQYSLIEGLNQTIEWYCNNKKWYQNLIKSDYLNRLGVIK